MAFSLKIGACLLIIWANYLLPADENNLYQVQEEQSLDDFLLCADAKKSVNSGSDEVLKRFKDNSLKKINAWIDGIAPSSDLPFLHKNVLVGADGEPKDHSRDSFKSALSECVGNFRVEDVSKNKRIKKIRLVEFINFHEQLMDVLIKKLNSFIEELLPYDGLFLNPSLFSNISTDHVSCKRDSFALSMQLAIMT
jgi:hypothetical protein